MLLFNHMLHGFQSFLTIQEACVPLTPKYLSDPRSWWPDIPGYRVHSEPAAGKQLLNPGVRLLQACSHSDLASACLL